MENNFRGKTTKVKKGSWTVFLGLCKGCGICLEKCPFKALIFSKDLGVYSTPVPCVDPLKCNLCGICEIFCPDSAIKVEK
ncbi:MAG: ATP-binding protein [Patescibacteria group bacterium]